MALVKYLLEHIDMFSIYFQVAGRSLGELVRKLGERVLPLIIPILSKGLKDSNPSRRQVSSLPCNLFAGCQFILQCLTSVMC